MRREKNEANDWKADGWTLVTDKMIAEQETDKLLLLVTLESCEHPKKLSAASWLRV